MLCNTYLSKVILNRYKYIQPIPKYIYIDTYINFYICIILYIQYDICMYICIY